MTRRQQRIERILAVAQEYLAAKTAGNLLSAQLDADPSFGSRYGWEPRAGAAFCDKLEATYIIRMYAEFEAGLRDYWKNHLGQNTRPPMIQLVRHAIPNQYFTQDCIDNADDVRVYRNFLVHDIEEDPPADVVVFSVEQAKTHLCTYFGRLDPRWH